MKKRVHKSLAMLLAVCIIVMLFPATASAAYSDTQGHWAQTAVEKWSDLGILQGSDGMFRPDDPITRGEMAIIIDRIMQYQEKAQNSFTDLGDTFYTDAVLKANAAGVIKGDGTTVRPTDNITREEAVVMLGRALGLTESEAIGTAFLDSGSISSWADGYINTMAKEGYVNGYGGAFDPKSSITRAAVVTILDNAVKKLFTEAKEYTGDVSGTAIVNAPGVTLKDMEISGDLIISEGVGSGDVTLDNVTVTGNTIVRGGGANSIHIKGGSQIANIIVEKTDSGDIRVVTSDGSVVEAVYVDDGSDDIILTGSFQSVTIAADVNVKAVDASIKTVDMTSEDASLDIDKDSYVKALNVAETAAGVSLTVSGSVGTLTTDAQITVDNQGTISEAVVNADDVIIDGSEPTKVVVGSDVTSEPTDSDGNIVDGSSSGSTGGGSSSVTRFSVSAAKLATVNNDVNVVESQENQDAVSVSKSSNTVTVTGDLSALNSFASTNEAQGTHKWVGLVIDTGESSIIGVSYSGTAFTQSDVDEAASVGVGAGKFVLWIKADEVATTAKTFTLSKSGKSTATITVNFTDATPEELSVDVTKLATVNQDDGNTTESQANQDAVTISKSGNTATVTGNLTSLYSFTSTDAAQGTHKWVGLVIDTGESDITNVYYNGSLLTETDVADAASVGVEAGSFVLWIKADEVVSNSKTFTLETDNTALTTITINFNNDVTAPTMGNLTVTFTDTSTASGASAITCVQGKVVDSIAVTMSEPVTVTDGAVVMMRGTSGDCLTNIPSSTEYGTISVDPQDSTKLIITPEGSNGTAGYTGTMEFTVAADAVKDVAQNGNALTTFTLTVTAASTVTDIAVKGGSETVVTAIDNTLATLTVANATEVAGLTGAIESTDGSTQTYAVTDSSDVSKTTGALVTGDKLVVTAEDGSTTATYAITVEAAVLPIATAALTDDDNANAEVSSPVSVTNAGDTLNYTLTLTGLE
ncbi:MAG: S-layer homology domain-containing protein, partial [Oscillospiraceae bacterium]